MKRWLFSDLRLRLPYLLELISLVRSLSLLILNQILLLLAVLKLNSCPAGTSFATQATFLCKHRWCLTCLTENCH